MTLSHKNLKLNMARGKPSPEQLELSMDMLNSSLSASDWISEDGTDVRNYGGLDGIPECKKLLRMSSVSLPKTSLSAAHQA